MKLVVPVLVIFLIGLAAWLVQLLRGP
jgi:hypothetical protein